MRTILFSPENCDGCNICAQVCALSHDPKGGFNPKRGRIKILEMRKGGLHVGIVCKQCEKAPCIENCPVGALERDLALGVTIVDSTKCIECGICTEVCPFGAIFLDPLSKKAIVCDLCQGDPECVEWCPKGALRYEAKNRVSQRNRYAYAQKVAPRMLRQMGVSSDLLNEDVYNQTK